MPKCPWLEFPLLFLMIVGPLMIIGHRSGMTPDRDSVEPAVRVKGIGVRVTNPPKAQIVPRGGLRFPVFPFLILFSETTQCSSKST